MVLLANVYSNTSLMKVPRICKVYSLLLVHHLLKFFCKFEKAPKEIVVQQTCAWKTIKYKTMKLQNWTKTKYRTQFIISHCDNCTKTIFKFGVYSNITSYIHT